MRWPRVSGVGVLLLVINAGLVVAFAYYVAKAPDAPVEAEGPAGIASFDIALRDARDSGIDEVSRELVALRQDDPSLFWDQSTGAPKVLAATWTSYSGYETNLSRACSLEVEVWVTPVPQVQDRCRRFGLAGAALSNRLEQYLGLAPSGGRASVVEMWVHPEDLFRPCPDPEIDDRDCRVGLPDIPTDPGEAALEHARWFKEQFGRYYEANALPWSRLGYTLDWGNPNTRIGASEYVIRPGSTVWIESTTPTEEYCEPGNTVIRRPPALTDPVGSC